MSSDNPIKIGGLCLWSFVDQCDTAPVLVHGFDAYPIVTGDFVVDRNGEGCGPVEVNAEAHNGALHVFVLDEGNQRIRWWNCRAIRPGEKQG